MKGNCMVVSEGLIMYLQGSREVLRYAWARETLHFKKFRSTLAHYRCCNHNTHIQYKQTKCEQMLIQPFLNRGHLQGVKLYLATKFLVQLQLACCWVPSIGGGFGTILPQNILNFQTHRNAFQVFWQNPFALLQILLLLYSSENRQKHDKKLTLPLFYQREVICEG